MSIFQSLIDVYNNRGACYVILIDPDNKNDDSILSQVEMANRSEVDAIFVGGSLMMDGKSNDRVKKIKQIANVPVILFPGGVNQITSDYNAILFLSLLSGRNPHYLIGEQVIAAPIVRDFGIETIPTGYLLVDGGSPTTVEFISGTKPLSPSRPDVIISHALAAQYLGMKLIYLEAGSGARNKIPENVIKKIVSEINISLIVGGGIRTPKMAKCIVDSGASYVVIGSAIEESTAIAKEFSSAIHYN